MRSDSRLLFSTDTARDAAQTPEQESEPYMADLNRMALFKATEGDTLWLDV